MGVPKCAALTVNGKACSRDAVEGEHCKQHGRLHRKRLGIAEPSRFYPMAKQMGQELAFVRRHSLGLVEVLDAALVLKPGAAGEVY